MQRYEIGWLYALAVIIGVIIGMILTSVYFHVNIQNMEMEHKDELIDSQMMEQDAVKLWQAVVSIREDLVKLNDGKCRCNETND